MKILHAGLVTYGREHVARGLTAGGAIRQYADDARVRTGNHSLGLKTQGGVEELTMLLAEPGSDVGARAEGEI